MTKAAQAVLADALRSVGVDRSLLLAMIRAAGKGAGSFSSDCRPASYTFGNEPSRQKYLREAWITAGHSQVNVPRSPGKDVFIAKAPRVNTLTTGRVGS